jgi:hypothetical protein
MSRLNLKKAKWTILKGIQASIKAIQLIIDKYPKMILSPKFPKESQIWVELIHQYKK